MLFKLNSSHYDESSLMIIRCISNTVIYTPVIYTPVIYTPVIYTLYILLQVYMLKEHPFFKCLLSVA